MEDDGFTLYEGWAIVRYLLDNKAPDSTLYPKDIVVRALIDMEVGRLNDLRVAQQVVLFARVMAPKMGRPAPPEQIIQMNEETMKKVYAQYEELLKEQKYLYKEQMTMLDFMFTQALMQGQVHVKIDL